MPESFQLLQGDCLEVLRTLPDASVNCCITSPPYFGLRDYGVAGQIGLEKSLAEYIGKLVMVFHEVRRVLTDDGTLWLNLGDGFACSKTAGRNDTDNGNINNSNGKYGKGSPLKRKKTLPTDFGSLKSKDLIGMPWQAAFALRDVGWYLRSDIVWQKPNPMPESIKDRPTRAHEFIFLMSKSQKYFYDANAIREPYAQSSIDRCKYAHKVNSEKGNGIKTPGRHWGGEDVQMISPNPLGRNKRDVWTVNTKSYKGAHFATFPEKLIEPCVLAGCPKGGSIIDPFSGAGTTGVVALQHGRNYIGIDLNPEYNEIARERIEAANR